MKRSVWMWVTALFLLGLTTGCEKPSPDTVKKGLNLAGEQGSYYGLKKWAESKPEAAKETATKLKASIDSVLLPYLDGGNLPTSDLVQEFVDSTLLDGLQDEVKAAIIAASVALDAVLPIPSPNSKLTPEQVDYIKAFLTGVSSGCEKFLAGADAPKSPKWLKDLQKKSKDQTKWLTGTKKKK